MTTMAEKLNQHSIKLALSDFGVDANPERLPWMVVLRRHFNIQLCDFAEADFLIYGPFGFKHTLFKKVKIFCTGENRVPDWNACDYAFTHEMIDSSRHFYLPYYAIGILANSVARDEMLNRPAITHEDMERNPRKFCNFIYRNHACKARNRLFRKLSEYKQVDAAGSLFNNIGYRIEYGIDENGKDRKVTFQGQYKFSFSFENERHPGYQTEKITDAFRARTIPIYWGNPKVMEEFNPSSFLCYHNFSSEQAFIERIIEIDQNDDLLLEYLNAPILTEKSRERLDEQKLAHRFEEIFRENKIQRTDFDRFKYHVSQIFGRGFFAQMRRFSRYLRGKREFH